MPAFARSMSWRPISSTSHRCGRLFSIRCATSTSSAVRSAQARDGRFTRMPSFDDMRRSYALWEGWGPTSLLTETVSVAGVQVQIAGFSAESTDGQEVTGSAADLVESPVNRAYCELLERASVVALSRTPQRKSAMKN